MKTGKWTMIVAMAAGMMWTGSARAGSLNPTNAPGPTMHTLEEIYQQLLAMQTKVMELDQKVSGAGLTNSGDMILIPAGNFMMGATTNAGHETITAAVPQHLVYVSAFFIDRYEVSLSLWSGVCAWATNKGYGFINASSGKAADHPVHTVDWYDCLKWCNARSVRDGYTPCYTNANGTVYTNGAFAGGCNWGANGYRLPSEAEWEKAARGGVAGMRFPWQDAFTIQHARANYMALPSTYTYDTSPTTAYHPAYYTGSTPYTSPVASFDANGYGLYGMAGNIWEWCWDWYGSTYYTNAPASNPTGPTSGTYRTMRGGSWTSEANSERCANRNYDYPTSAFNSIGFRCVREP